MTTFLIILGALSVTAFAVVSIWDIFRKKDD